MPKAYGGIGPRWLAWLLFGFAVVEVPWVVYLALFQVRTGTAHHVQLAALGMGAATIATLTIAAVGLWLGKRWTPVPVTMAATMLLAGGVLTVLVSSLNPVYVALPGVLAALAGSYRSLRGERFAQPTDRWLAALLAVIALVLVIRLGIMLAVVPATLPADHLRALVVLLDTGQVLCLAGAGFGLLRTHAQAAVFYGSAGVVLFVGDAWCNLVLVPSGQAFAAAVFYAVVGEIPATAMSAFAVVLAMRVLASDSSATRSSAGHALLP